MSIDAPPQPIADAKKRKANSPVGSPPGETLGHRMRTPLHTILGYAGLLKADANQEVFEQLDTIEDCARQLLAIINELPESASLVIHAPQTSAGPVHAEASDTIADLIAPLPNAEITTFRNLLQFGRLLQIERWATGQIDLYPTHAGLARHMITLSRSANLPALKSLLKKWTESSELNQSSSA